MTTMGNRRTRRDDQPADNFDLESLLHPAQAFDSPADVLSDPDLTRNEKRAILASWASDACAVEANPALRLAPAGKVVPFDKIADALRQLDRPPPTVARRLDRSSIFSQRSRAIWRRPAPRKPEPPRPDNAA